MDRRSSVVMPLISALTLFGPCVSAAEQSQATLPQSSQKRTSVTIDLPVVTQGPFWPPGEVVDSDHNFIVIGNVMTEVAPGQFAPIPNQAVLVSKDTVPPLDANGVEDPSNWFGAAYKVIRPLDLSPNSPDLNTVLYSVSFGPAVGPHGRAPRIPMEGVSAYNLNGDYETCKEVFPSESQKSQFKRPSFPLHQVPVAGFQGDQVAYDADTGDAYDPSTATGEGCGFNGCSGEDVVDTRRETPITLGEWLKAKGQAKITLTKYDKALQAYTHARFDLKFSHLLPNSLYTTWVVRLRQVPTLERERRDIDPIATPNVIVTDRHGNASASYELPNPFPDPATDARGLRIIGLSVVYHSDAQIWGACFDRLGPGVGAHAVFSTLGNGTTDITSFITRSPNTITRW